MTDYMSPAKTLSIKGIFVLLVFFSHFNSYVTLESSGDIFYKKLIGLVGQIMVTMFLFYSGYGIMESIKKKKAQYVHKIPVNRICNVLFRFDAAILLFAAVKLILGESFTLKQFLLSLVAWDALGNSNWYIFAVIVAYAATFIAFEIFKDKGNFYPGAICVLLLLIAFVVCFKVFNIKPVYWYDTILCYPLGMLFALRREKIERAVNKSLVTYFLSLAAAVAAFLMCYRFKGLSMGANIGVMLLSCLVIVLVTMHASIDNIILRWFGKHLFGVYILQ